MNETLADLQDKLVRLHKKLRDQLAQTDDAAARAALVNEIPRGHSSRSGSWQSFFAADAEKLDDKVKEISAATKKVTQAIAQIQQLQAFLDTVSDFLSLVDEAIDLAKSLSV